MSDQKEKHINTVLKDEIKQKQEGLNHLKNQLSQKETIHLLILRILKIHFKKFIKPDSKNIKIKIPSTNV